MSITAVSGFMNNFDTVNTGIVYDTNGDFVVATASEDFNWNDNKKVELGKIEMKSLKTKIIQIGDVHMIRDYVAGSLRTARVHFEFPGYPGLKCHLVGISKYDPSLFTPTPTPTPSCTSTITYTFTDAPTPTPTSSATCTSTPSETYTFTDAPTPTPTSSATYTSTSTETSSATCTPTPSRTYTFTDAETSTPTPTPSLPQTSDAYVYETDPIGTIDVRLKDLIFIESPGLEISVVNNKIRFENVKEDEKYIVHIPTAAFINNNNLVDASKSIDDPNLYHSTNGFTLFIKSQSTSFGTVATPLIEITPNKFTFNKETYYETVDQTDDQTLTQVIEYKINTVHFNVQYENVVIDEEIPLETGDDFEISSEMLVAPLPYYLVSYESSMMNHRDTVIHNLNKY